MKNRKVKQSQKNMAVIIYQLLAVKFSQEHYKILKLSEYSNNKKHIF